MAMVAILVNAIRDDGPDRVWLVRGIASGSTKRTCLGQMVKKRHTGMVRFLGNSFGGSYRWVSCGVTQTIRELMEGWKKLM